MTVSSVIKTDTNAHSLVVMTHQISDFEGAQCKFIGSYVTMYSNVYNVK